MTEILSFIFDRLTDPLGLPIGFWKEWIITLIIGELAYIFAFRIIGNMYDVGFIVTRSGGKILHWTIRLLFYVAMWAVTYFAIWLGKWIIANWVLSICIAGCIAMFIAGIYTIIRHNRKGGVKNA